MSSSITLPSAPVSPFQYVMVGFDCAEARRTTGSVAAAPAAPRRKSRRSTLTIEPPRPKREAARTIASALLESQHAWCLDLHARGGRVLSPGTRWRERLRHPTLRESQPCGLRALAKGGTKPLAPPRPRRHPSGSTTASYCCESFASIPSPPEGERARVRGPALTGIDPFPRVQGHGHDWDRPASEDRDGGPADLWEFRRAYRALHLWRHFR